MILDETLIRQATRADAELIADFSRQTFFETFAPQNTPGDMEIFMKEQFTKESLIAEVSVPSNIFLLAYTAGELAGYVKLRDALTPPALKEIKSLEIARLYAATQMIGKGVGKMLMQCSVNLARQKRKQAIWLAVWEKNDRAYNFYTRWGFEVFSNQLFILGTDLQKDWLMKRML